MGAGPHGGSRADGSGSRDHDRHESAGDDNRREHSSHHNDGGFGAFGDSNSYGSNLGGNAQPGGNHGRGESAGDDNRDEQSSHGSLPEGFGGTENIDGTSTPGLGETQRSQNNGRGDWMRDPVLAGRNEAEEREFQQALEQERWYDNLDWSFGLAGSLAGPIGSVIGNSLVDVYRGVRDFFSEPTQIEAATRGYYDAAVRDAPIIDTLGYVGGGLSFASNFVPGLRGVSAIANNPAIHLVTSAANQAYRNKQVDDMTGAPASRVGLQQTDRDRGGNGSGGQRTVFSGGVPSSPTQQIAQTRPVLNLIHPNQQNNSMQFGNIYEQQQPMQTQMPESTFAPIEGVYGGQIASNTPFVTMDSNNRNTLLASNTLQANDFSTPDNLFNPGKKEDEFYKMLHSRSQLWKGGYI